MIPSLAAVPRAVDGDQRDPTPERARPQPVALVADPAGALDRPAPVSRDAREPSLLTGLQQPDRGTNAIGRPVRLAASGWDNVTIDELPQLRDAWFNKTEEFVPSRVPVTPAFVPTEVAPVTSTADRDALVRRLTDAGFRPYGAQGVSPRDGVWAPDAVQRFRIADGTRLGYPGPLNIFVPANFSAQAPAHVYLHGYMLADRGNQATIVERQVFGRDDQHSFFEMMRASRTRGMSILPESTGQNTQFNAAFGGLDGARRFDTLMTNVAGLAGRQQFTAASLSTHSGSGLLGDRLVLNSRFGREVVRFRGHFDDGFGTNDWRTRYEADLAIARRGGTVLALARTPQHSDHIGEGSNHMNAAAYYERTGQNPVFETTPYYRNGRVVGSDTFVRADQRLPMRPMSEFLGEQLPARISRFNVTTRNHWEPIDAWATLLRMSNPAPAK